MYSSDFIKFLSENWTLFEKCELSEPLLLFFILKNLYHSIFPNLNDFSIVDESTFNSVVDDSTSQKHFNTNGNFYTSCILFSKDNYLLKETQKNLLKILFTLDGNKEEQRSYFKNFRIFYSKDSEGRNYVLVAESHLYYIVKTLTSILETDKSKYVQNKSFAFEKSKEYLDNFRNKKTSIDFDSLIKDESLRPWSSNLLKLSLCYFLLHINPSFSGVSKKVLKLLNQYYSKLSRKALFNSTLIINNLIRLHPKESDLWEIKSLLTYLWFKKYNLRIKKVVLHPNGCFEIKPNPTNLYYSYLMKIIYRLFKDKLLLMDQSFIPDVLSLKPFNNFVATYLNYQYKFVVKSVVSLFMRKIKEPCNFNNLNKTNKYNKFEEFNYLSYETRYNISLCNSIFKLFYGFHMILLKKFSFPSLFILLVNLLKERNYNKLHSSSINHRYLYESSCLYTRLDNEFEDVLNLCDEMIKKDSENCWVDNKSKLMYHILDLNSLLKPFYFNSNLVDLVFKFKIIFILNQHLSTWTTVLNLSKICDICTSLYSDISKARLKNRLKFNKENINKNKKKKNKNVKILIYNIDIYKSESVLIRKLVNEYLDNNINNNTNDKDKNKENINNNNDNDKKKINSNEQEFQNYGYRYIYLESLELCNKFDDFQLDHILKSFNQLMFILFHLFRNISKLKRNPRFHIDLSDFKVLFETIRLVFKYSRTFEIPGNKRSVLVEINLVKKMNKEYRLIMYKYYKLLKTGDVPYYLEMTLARLSLLLLSPPFRLYLYWNVSSHSKLELVVRQITMLTK